MLPVKEKSSIYYNKTTKEYWYSDNVLYKTDDVCIAQHLYILSDEEIKEGDWFLDTYDNVLQCASITSDTVRYIQDSWECFAYRNHVRKIIATTDSLPLNSIIHNGDLFVSSIPKSFSFLYIYEYNKGNVIKEVEVKYEDCGTEDIGSVGNLEHLDTIVGVFLMGHRLRINSDNIINIKRSKDSWTKEELEIIIHKCAERLKEYQEYAERL